MVTATRTVESVEVRETSIEDLGEMMGIPIKVLPWWGSRRQGSQSGLGGVKRWLCPASPMNPKKRPEIRNGVIYLWAGECHYQSHYRGKHTHRQTVTIKDAQGQAILIELRLYTISQHLLGVDSGVPYVVQVVRRVQSVNEAFDWLMPKKVKEAAIQGLDVKRQGDWFFIPHGREPNFYEWDKHLLYGLYKRNHLYKNFPLCYSGAETRHRASQVVYNSILGLPCETPVIKGTVRAPDHETICLEDWHLAIRNRSHPHRNTDLRNDRGVDD